MGVVTMRYGGFALVVGDQYGMFDTREERDAAAKLFRTLFPDKPCRERTREPRALRWVDEKRDGES